jgi:hypothetical protein
MSNAAPKLSALSSQIECEVINHDSATVPDFYIEISPKDCVQVCLALLDRQQNAKQCIVAWTSL